jgi:hypothetical protein
MADFFSDAGFVASHLAQLASQSQGQAGGVSIGNRSYALELGPEFSRHQGFWTQIAARSIQGGLLPDRERYAWLAPDMVRLRQAITDATTVQFAGSVRDSWLGDKALYDVLEDSRRLLILLPDDPDPDDVPPPPPPPPPPSTDK